MKRFGLLAIFGSIIIFSDLAVAGEKANNLHKIGDALFDASQLDNYGLDYAPNPYVITPASFAAADEGRIAYALRRIETPDIGSYNLNRFTDQTAIVSLDLVGILAANTYFGTSSNNWGKSKFHFTNEGWFGKDTYALGMDKLGHAYGTMLYADYFTQRIAHSTDDLAGAAVTGALLGFGVQSSVEFFDAYSQDFGFSNEDLISDAVGAGFSVLRNTVPGLARKLDFRLEYGFDGKLADFSPFNDYKNQKYVLALKLSGFEAFEDTPLRFVELQAGYFARGFTAQEKAQGADARREPYVAIGFNLGELFDTKPIKDTVPGLFARRTLEYIEVPYTYAATTQN
jgi:Predicted periplasmic lipoprotein (DUF2279)